ncbi:NADPH-dependent FMN reductase [Mycobacterium tuberculosis]|uniref:NAD(P)H-dependent oxidoreductase n=1 Tax=Mycobacterium tuberculosis TaxID=1773 RepID=UPI00061BD481|nr:NADPH-dependent FMN reductase [Mycobacterium tuberculosis]CNM53025.1 NADPH-dependent FMN reductase [Mycobacterium tuberculosis]
MSDTKSDIKILALVGSLRAASFNRQIAELAAKVAPDGVTVTMFEGLGDLPFYNEDIDTATEGPAPVSALREAASDAHAALVVTPEYNGSIPAVIGGSMGRYGGVWAHDETRKSFSIAGTRVVDAIKLSVPFQTLGKSVADDAGLAANVRDAVGNLAAEVG